MSNLRQQRQLWKLSTWRSGARILWGAGGLLRSNLKPWLAYLREDFHPSQQHSGLAERWLVDNRAVFEPVSGARRAPA